MNIVYLCRSFANRGGTENYVFFMAKTLAKKGHRIFIVSGSGQGAWDFGEDSEKITIHNIDFKAEPFSSSWRVERVFPLFTYRYGMAVERALTVIQKRYGIDIVEVPDWSGEAWRFIKHRTVPVCVRFHGYPQFKQSYEDGLLRKGMRNRVLWNMLRKSIVGADALTAVSKDYFDFAKKMWDVQDVSAHIIPIGIDCNLFKPLPSLEREHALLFAGRLEEYKGAGVLAEALPMVLKEFPNLKVYFVGKNDALKEGSVTWKQFIRSRLTGKHHVEFLGAVPTLELIKYYQKCSVCAFPSLYEPGGTVALESMACGAATVVSAVGGFRELVIDGVDGVMVPAGDAVALAKGICRLLKDKDFRQRIAQAGFDKIRSQYTIERAAERTLEVYQDAIAKFKNEASGQK